MTIAGSDSGGGAGIQADLKTFATLGCFGTCAVTCVTAQNPRAVRRITTIAPGMIARQIDAVCDAFSVAAAKTGMLFSAAAVRAVAKAVARRRITILVVDPVMVASSGARLLKQSAVKPLAAQLLPMATVVTPNVFEAETLCGHAIKTLDQARNAACEIGRRFRTACVITGGHLHIGTGLTGRRAASRARAMVHDVLYCNGKISVFTVPRVKGQRTHGTGCTYSAALTAFLAHGDKLAAAARKAQKIVAAALMNPARSAH